LIRLRRISGKLDKPEIAQAFTRFKATLAKQFPRVHAATTQETINEYSLLYRWPGRDESLSPVVLTAHLDVVPAPEADAWTHPPFGGVVQDGVIWGRGALDDKLGLAGVLEAAEILLTDGYQPRRDIYFAFGHDEEIGGQDGAVAIAEVLAARGIEPFFVLDEGSLVVDGAVDAVTQPLALIGIAEKGYLSLRLIARSTGGHSSMPPQRTAIGRLAAAIEAIQASPLRTELGPTMRAFFRWIGPEAKGLTRMAATNLWLFSPLVLRQMLDGRATAAQVQTTFAPTILRAGVKENVLPSRAEAVVNLRLLPGDTIAAVTRRLRGRVADYGIEVTPASAMGIDPSPVAPVDAPQFRYLHMAARSVFEDALVAPSLVVGATDARHYARLTDHVYRFLPVRLHVDEVSRFHGIDEQISVAAYADAIRFYVDLLRRSGTAPPPMIDRR